jgi:hypothetical protein
MAEEKKYESGYEFWRDLSVRYGVEEAHRILGEYLSLPLWPGVINVDAEDRFCIEACTAANVPVRLRPSM